MRWSLLSLFVVVLVAGCGNQSGGGGSGGGGGTTGGGTATSCDSTNCAGCCDAQGQCQGGTALTQCGASGGACANCLLLHSSCTAGTCVPAPDGGGAGGGGGASVGGGDGTTGGGTGTGGGSATGGGSTTGGGTATGGGSATDGGIDTYPDGGSLYSLWDGGSCAVMTDCPCFSSDECGPGFVCQSQGSDFDVYCVPGQRGSGLVGTDCTSEADCLSSLCIDSADGGKACTALCGGDGDCAPAVSSCNAFFAICTP